MNAQEYILNIRPGVGYAPTVKISQYDIGRPLQFHLYDGTAPLAIATGTTIKIHATKPSGLGFEEACTWSGSSASIDTTESMTQEYGIFPAELELSVGGDIIGTANFMMHIERSPHPEGTTDGVAEDLQDIYEQLDDLKSDIGDLDDLETTDKSNLVAAINEAAQSGGGSSVSPYTSNPAALGTASPGSVNKYSRGDHVHPLPTASAIGALPSSTTAADIGGIAEPPTATEGQVLTYGANGWEADDPQRVDPTEVTISDSGSLSPQLDSGKIYHFTSIALTALSITLKAATGIAQYHFDFISPATAVTFTLPNSVTMPDSFTVEANKRYEIDILNNYGVVQSWDWSAA